MKKISKTLTLSTLFILSSITASILLFITLSSNFYLTSNKNTSLNTSQKNNHNLRTNFTKEMADAIIIQKELDMNWDGSLVEADFINVTSIAASAFESNTKITSISLPTTVKTIGTNAFANATNLITITTYGATIIWRDAFNNLNNLNTLNLTYSAPLFDSWKTWTSIGDYPTNWKKIKWINPPTKPVSNLTITSDFIFDLIRYKEFNNSNVWNGVLVEADFINTTSVANGAFWNNIKITSITLPDTVISIGTNAFNGAINLNTVSALGATNIGTNAFAKTISLIPKGIKLTSSVNISPNNAKSWGIHFDKLDIQMNTLLPVVNDEQIDLIIIISISIVVALLLVLNIGGFIYYRKNISK